MLFYKTIASLLLILFANTMSSQLSLTEIGVEHSISFDESLSGVNEGSFAGLGLSSNPLLGELDSDAWIVNGCSDGDTQFSDVNNTDDYARGTSTGGITSGGIYAFNTGSNSTFGWQSTGSDLSPGEIILKIQNQSNFSIERLEISYTIWLYNDQNRSQKLSCYYSYDNSTYYALVASDYISQTNANPSPIWTDSFFSFTLETNEIQNNDYFYLKWRIADEAGSGSRDEWALDDIGIKITNNLCMFEDWSYVDTTGTLISNEGFNLYGVDSYYTTPINVGSHSPSARMDDNLDRITSPLITNAFSMKFWLKGLGNLSGSSLAIEGFNGVSWVLLDEIDPLPGSGTIYSIQNLSAYSQFRFTYTKVNGNLAIDDISILCGTCALSSPSPTMTGSISFPEIYCNQAEVSWPNIGAEYYLVLATEKPSISFSPLDHRSYYGNASFEEGEMVEDSVYVVYNGSGSEFTLNQLTSNSNYLLKVIPYNGLSCEENYSTSFITATLSTPNCTQCPYLVSALINACSGSCTNQEGYNEFVIINSGAYSFAADTSEFKINFDKESLLNENTLSNPSLLADLNSMTDCPSLFIDALSVATIPIESTILLCHNSICVEDIDKAVFCFSPVVYVLFCDSDDWNPNGEFSNVGYAQHDFTLDFRSVSSNCLLNYSYIANDIPQEDGTSIFFSPEGGGFTNFNISEDCTINLNPLPLVWGDIEVKQMGKRIELNWSTLSEWNNLGFSVERSKDGEDFKEVSFLISNGDSEFGFYYNYIDEVIQSATYIYRIKQIDNDGTYSYSTYVGIEVSVELYVYQDNYHLILDGLENDKSAIELITLQNELILKKDVDGKRVYVDLDDISTGIYLLRIVSKGKVKTRKVFIKAF